MEISKAKLQQALEAVKPGLAGKEIFLEQSTSFVFVGDKVLTYNDEISIQHPIEGMNVTGAIKANELYAFLKKVKTDEIDIEQGVNELIFRSGKAKAGFTLQTEIKLPMEEVESVKEYTPLPDNFIKALQFVLFTCATETIRPMLNCVHIRSDGWVESSDGYRITIHQLTGKQFERPVLIPASSVRELIKYSVNKVAISNGWLHLTDGNMMFSCRIVNEVYPDTTGPLSMDKPIDLVFPEEFLDSLQRACIFSADQPNNDVTVDAAKNRIYVRAKSDIAWFEEWIRCQTPDEFTLCINAIFLMDILQHTREAKLSSQKIKFSTPEWIHISMLISKK